MHPPSAKHLKSGATASLRLAYSWECHSSAAQPATTYDNHQHSIHLDGNKKLYRFSKVPWYVKIPCMYDCCLTLLKKILYILNYVIQQSNVPEHAFYKGVCVHSTTMEHSLKRMSWSTNTWKILDMTWRLVFLHGCYYNSTEMQHTVLVRIHILPLSLACVAQHDGRQQRQHQRQCHTWMKLALRLLAAGMGLHRKQSTCFVEKCKVLA